ncbi:RNase P/MRP, p29 subunit [Crepidotus variabilis]|uniref:Ribonuclease P protein subunit n=1 Tax=Crepidotus variabilis TaxID=179855 RepID=A0A9P6JIH2_9AGAR|nr:RNase P/MRP, p29 subunit [Crepidotus variabilis]
MTSNTLQPSGSKPATLLDPYAQVSFGKAERLRFSTSSPFTPNYVSSNLSGSSDPMAMYNARVKGRQILLENPAKESRLRKMQEERRTKKMTQKERKKVGLIGRREAKQKGVWKFDSAQARFRLFLPLHQLWMGYMSELLNLQQRPAQPVSRDMVKKAMPSASSMHPKLLKADFHGSIVSVSQSKNPSIVGVSGIVIYETENTFKVITREDKVKTIPKQNSVFSFAVPLYSTLSASHHDDASLPIPTPLDSSGEAAETLKTVLDTEHLLFQLYGNQFRFRSADRAGRKFKHKETIEL